MFIRLKQLLPVLTTIADALVGVEKALHERVTEGTAGSDLAGRVAALELELERRHAEAEGLLLKAQGKFDAARAAEERSRRAMARAEERDQGGEEDADEQLDALRAYLEEAGVPRGNGNGGGEEGVPSLSVGMESRYQSKSNAHTMKFSRL